MYAVFLLCHLVHLYLFKKYLLSQLKINNNIFIIIIIIIAFVILYNCIIISYIKFI